MKEGRSRKDSKPDPSDTEELHVLVTGDNDADVDKVGFVFSCLLLYHGCCHPQGAALAAKLLTPMDEATQQR